MWQNDAVEWLRTRGFVADINTSRNSKDQSVTTVVAEAPTGYTFRLWDERDFEYRRGDIDRYPVYYFDDEWPKHAEEVLTKLGFTTDIKSRLVGGRAVQMVTATAPKGQVLPLTTRNRFLQARDEILANPAAFLNEDHPLVKAKQASQPTRARI